MNSSKRSAREKMNSSNGVMDPDLWGNLQDYICLENVYLKLPLRDFFQLRGVCKDWNRLARQRRCLTDPIHKPYFVIPYPVTVPYTPYHTGILTFHIASGQWKWNRLPFESNQLTPLYQSFSVQGVVFGVCTSRDVFQVFDVHTKRSLGSIFQPSDTIGKFRTLGMAVDTSVMPHTFKIILGGLDTKTIIYDSVTKSWETRSSLMLTPPSKRWAIKSCLQCDGDVYIWSQMHTILVYSLMEDIWSTLDPPPQQYENDRVGGAMGYWDGRVFIVMADGCLSLSVWELVNRSEHAWRKFACIPAEMHAWLVPQGDDSTRMFANFCEEHVLIHTLLDKNAPRTGIGKNIVLFNLATKRWEKIDIGLYGLEPKRRVI